MKIFLLTPKIELGLDDYLSCVVIAKNEEDAKLIHPNGDVNDGSQSSWVSPDMVEVEEIGVAKKGATRGVVCIDFNAA